MGNKEEETPAKNSKSSTQEQAPPSSPATVFPDWAAFQAYYNSTGTPVPPGFYHSPVASSPQGHPYVWGPQHIIPPYGAPTPPYVAMYPPGGLYPHPTMPPGSHPYSPYAMTPSSGTTDASVGAAEGDGKSVERDKASGASTNGVESESDESGSEASSEGSDANSQSGSQENRSRKKNTAGGESKNTGTSGSESSKTNRKTQAHASNHVSPIMAIPSSAITAPTTTLNIGMDYWGGPSTAVTPLRSKLPITPSPAAGAPARSAAPQEIWSQDEREMKRQRRKQSNRESARRSRLRKQAEYDELAHRVGSLTDENNGLREELARIRSECEKLASENASLSEKLKNPAAEEPSMSGAAGQPESNS